MDIPYRLSPMVSPPEREDEVRRLRERIRSFVPLSEDEIRKLVMDPDERIFERLCLSVDGGSLPANSGSMLFAAAVDRAAAEGVLWSPSLEAASRAMAIHQREAVEDVERQRMLLAPWVTSVRDWNLLAPLWDLGTTEWQEFIGEHASVLPLGAIDEATTGALAVIVGNPRLSMEVRRRTADHLISAPLTSGAHDVLGALRQGLTLDAGGWAMLCQRLVVAVAAERRPSSALILCLLEPGAVVDATTFRYIATAVAREPMVYYDAAGLYEALINHPLSSSKIWSVMASCAGVREESPCWRVLFDHPGASADPEVLRLASLALDAGDLSLIVPLATHLPPSDLMAHIRNAALLKPEFAASALLAAPSSVHGVMTEEDLDTFLQSPSAALRTAAYLASGSQPEPILPHTSNSGS